MTEMTERQTRELFTEHGLQAYRQITHARPYACDDRARLELAALAKAQQEIGAELGHNFTREAVTEALTKLVDLGEESLVQQRPPPEPELPKPWRDPETGEVCQNPYASDDLDSRMVLRKRAPALADWLEAVAKGTSYSFLAKRQDELAAREALRKLPYGHKEHERNPWREGAGGLDERSAFAKKLGEETAAFYRREGSTPVRMSAFAGNDVLRAKIRKGSDPNLIALVDQAVVILRGWLESDRRQIEQQAQRHSQQAAELQKQLAGVRRPPAAVTIDAR